MANPIATPTGTADIAFAAGRGKLFGFAARESAGSAAVATFIIRDGTSASGILLIPVELAANTSTSQYFSEPIEFDTGLFLDRVAGETEVTVFVS